MRRHPAGFALASLSSAVAQRILELTQSLHHDGSPSGAIHLPNLAAESTAEPGIVTWGHLCRGVWPILASTCFGVLCGTMDVHVRFTRMGQITLNNASSTYIDGDGADMFGIQLNSVLENVLISPVNSSYQFWTQNF